MADGRAITVVVESRILDTPRVQQLRGLFDLPEQTVSRLQWTVRMPLDERPWNVGLMVGPSGCGKSTLARRLWPAELRRSETLAWPEDRAVIDVFPEALPVAEIAALLSAVGFSSPPAWLRPFGVLSTGQQFRVRLARLLAETGPGALVVCDEFTSVVDRTVAQLGSAAVARAVRQRRQRFVAVTCHEDVLDWLQPDWVYRPAEGAFAWRSLRPRPDIVVDIVRCAASAWPLFAAHHYLSGRLAPGAVCFLATHREHPVGFSAWVPFVGSGPRRQREHRTVVLPDYQGVGLGSALSDRIASLWKGLGCGAVSTTTHPGLIRSRCRGRHWRLTRAPGFVRTRDPRLRHATARLTAGFEYVGPALPRRQALALLTL
jgi:GNAT superfamily N-acetyltransferase